MGQKETDTPLPQMREGPLRSALQEKKIEVFYINVVADLNRRKHIEKELTEIGLPAKRFEGLNKRSQQGCTESHIALLRQAQGTILIIEDDAKFKPNFPAYAIEALNELPPEWDLLFFYHHSCCGRSKTLALSPHLMFIESTLYTHCYLVNGKSTQKIFQMLENKSGAIDYLYQKNSTKLDILATRENLVCQMAGKSTTNKILKTDR